MNKLWFRWRNLKKRSLLLTSSILACMVIAYSAMTAVVRGDGVIVSVAPSTYNVSAPGTTFQLNITITGVPTTPNNKTLWSWSLKVTWNPAILNCSGADEGPFTLQAAPTFYLASPPDNVVGTVDQITDTSMHVPPKGAGGSGVLAILTFTSIKAGDTNISILKTDFMAVDKSKISVTVQNGTVIVIPEFPTSAVIPAFLIITTAIAVIIAKISRPRRRLDYTKAP
jgi:hypothetical protein